MPPVLLLALSAAFGLFFPFSLEAQIIPDLTLSSSSSTGNVFGDIYEEKEGRGLYIRSNPSGARVFIDGIEMGRTPLYLETLRPGSCFVRLEREGYQDRRFRVVVRSGSVINVLLEMNKAVGRVLLNIQSGEDEPDAYPPDTQYPFNPIIIVDGVIHTDPALELPVGFRTILVRAFGWEDVSTTIYIEDESFRELELKLRPALFRLSKGAVSRLKFNPANAGSLGTTAFNFEVSAPGRGSFIALDPDGKTVFARELGPFETWPQSAVWNGRNSQGEILGDGVYKLIVQAVSSGNSIPTEESLAMEVVLDSTRVIFPLSLSSGKSGLLFAPLPTPLPGGSFQIEGSLMAGYAFGSDGPWKSLPFTAAFRFSPLESLEVSAALNVIPLFEGDVGAGVSGGVKWAFLNSGIFGAAAGFNFSWTGKTGLTPFGMASGIELYAPLKLDLGNIFSLALSPSLLWTGDEGFPWEGAPRLLVSGGLMMRLTYVIAGLSARTEFNFSRNEVWPPLILAGAEVKFFPPPSSFVISVNGGVWARGSSLGGFAGLGIGMIH